jgi:hypothetical protein
LAIIAFQVQRIGQPLTHLRAGLPLAEFNRRQCCSRKFASFYGEVCPAQTLLKPEPAQEHAEFLPAL